MTDRTTGTARVKRGLAEMLRGGVIMDVVTPEQAKIAEDAGAVAVMALERVPADIRAQGGVARMSDPDLIDGIINEVSIPVMRALVRTPASLPSSTIVRANSRASPRSFMNAPEPTLTSSTRAPVPSAIFLLMIELAISGMDSTVPVTSRSA